jgi:glycosyltransferase involved in cell wall biosynthesis
MTFANRNRGGSGVYARSLLRSLQQQEDISAREVAGPARSDFVGTMRWLLGGARNALQQQPPDLLHCPSFVVPWLLPVPFVVTAHDAGVYRNPGDHPLEWRVYDRALQSSRLRAASRVIVGSEFARREVIQGYRVDPDRVMPVPYGIDPGFFAFTSPEPAGSRGNLLFPGAPVGRKNLGLVLRAMAGAPPESALAKARLDISGAGAEDFPADAALIESLGLQGRVQWLGQVDAAAMPALVASASALVYPSLYEGFGFPALEALAAGTPVVASDRGSLPEVLGDAALLINPTAVGELVEALEAVLSQPELCSRLVEQGRRRARQFTWERCAELTAEVYRSALAEIHRQ